MKACYFYFFPSSCQIHARNRISAQQLGNYSGIIHFNNPDCQLLLQALLILTSFYFSLNVFLLF